MSATDVVITAAKRTPVGSFLGAFASTPAHELGRIAIVAALEQAGVAPEDVSEVILGQVLTAAQGQNPARQASMAAGVPKEVPAWGVNQVCGSGLRAVALASQAIQTGDATIVVAGGQESMSLSAHAQHLRGGTKMGDLSLVDTMVKDGLTDVFNGYHMGMTAENLAEQYQVTRGDQDSFAVASQNKAEAARAEGRFKDEIAPVAVKTRKGETIVDQDEYIRAGATVEGVSGLRPAFKKDGTVTAANASGLNDGAAALVLMSREEAERRGSTILGRWRAGPRPESTRRSWASDRSPRPGARSRSSWSVADLDLIEANEAFAAQALAVGKELGWDSAKSTSMAERSPSATRSERAAPGCSPPSSMKWPARREKGPRDPMHRRRHGHRPVHRALRQALLPKPFPLSASRCCRTATPFELLMNGAPPPLRGVAESSLHYCRGRAEQARTI